MATQSQKVIELLIQAVDNATPALKKVSASINQLIGTTEKVSKGMNSAGDASAKMGRNVSAAGTSVDKGKKSLDDFDKTAGRATYSVASLAAQLAIVAGAVGLILWPVKEASEFEYSMAQVGVISQSTGETLESLSAFAMEMGQVTLFSATEAADGMKLLALAGLSVEQVMQTLPNVLNLAVIGNMSVAESAKLATNILYGFGLAASEMSHVIDALAYTSTKTKSTIQDLGYGMSYVAPIAASLGVDFDELTAAMGLLNNAGIEASRAGTSLRMALGRLLNPSRQASQSMEDVANRIGQANINVLDAQGNFLGLEAIIRQLEDANLTAGEALQIFGQRAGPGMAALVNQGADALERLTVGIKTSDGTAQEFSDTLIQTMQGSITILSGHFKTFATILGTSLIPEFKAVVDEADVFLLSITSLSQAFPAMSGALTFFVTGIGLAVAAMTAFDLITKLFSGTTIAKYIASTATAVASTGAWTVSLGALAAAEGVAWTGLTLLADAIIFLESISGFIAIAATAGALYYFFTEAERAKAATEEFIAKQNELVNSSKRYEEQLKVLAEQESRGVDITKERESIIDKLIQKYPELGLSINKVTTSLDDVIAKYKEIKQQELEKSIIDQQNAISGLAVQLTNTGGAYAHMLGLVTKVSNYFGGDLEESVRGQILSMVDLNSMLDEIGIGYDLQLKDKEKYKTATEEEKNIVDVLKLSLESLNNTYLASGKSVRNMNKGLKI